MISTKQVFCWRLPCGWLSKTELGPWVRAWVQERPTLQPTVEKRMSLRGLELFEYTQPWIPDVATHTQGCSLRFQMRTLGSRTPPGSHPLQLLAVPIPQPLLGFQGNPAAPNCNWQRTEPGREWHRGLIAGQWLTVWASALLGVEWDRPLSATEGVGGLSEVSSLEMEAWEL